GWESNPRIKVLQTSPLPLGYRASKMDDAKNPRARRGRQTLERETGFEPATSTLARSHSTTELLPLAELDYSESLNKRANESGDGAHENVTRAKVLDGIVRARSMRPCRPFRTGIVFPPFPALRLRLRAGLNCAAPTALDFRYANVT